MDKSTRNDIQNATQAARKLLEEAYREQLEGTYDILSDGIIAEQAGSHLSELQKVTREKLVAAVAHKRSTGLKAKEAVDAYLREAAFTTLNRFVALKMLEARKLVQECVTKGEDSSGFKEFNALAPGLVAADDKGYRLYIEMLFDEIGQEVKVLFDRRDVASLLWPDRQTLLELLGILNASELDSVWAEDETIGWVYQYFNGDEERTKMRAESQAPRNSRELAVRNQFFTPRYVVQFLTDNTLGRTWYEMMQGETNLAHLDYLVRRPSEVFLDDTESAPDSEVDDIELSQEELLKQTVYVPFRSKKDPRDLRILDPACGSGHFLLYAFDLLTTIYEEAWGDSGAAIFTDSGTQLQADYSSIEELRRAMPELILRHNLHGVDIDPRAAQIAALALWMRAQRAYNQFGVDRAQRSSITKTNIVVAEPMPGDGELVEEFAFSLKPTVLGDLFKKMVEEMKLAGELGSLLKIEESIAKAVKEAEEAHRQEGLFAEKIESQDFWGTADEKIIAALGSFAESAVGSVGIRRQLFAGDAAQGVAFIELMRKQYDVLLMNPPYGKTSSRTKKYIAHAYPSSWLDLYLAFIERSRVLVREGLVGVLVSRTWMFLSKFKAVRSTWIHNRIIRILLDMGAGVLDGATVETSVVVFDTTGRVEEFLYGTPQEFGSTGSPLLGKLPHQELAKYSTKFLKTAVFDHTPANAIIVEMAGDSNRQGGETPWIAKPGIQTSDDFRFSRLWWEVPQTAYGPNGWATAILGGQRSQFFGEHPACLKWFGSGREVSAFIEAKQGAASRGMRNADVYLSEGLTYQYTGKTFRVHPLPTDCIITVAGQGLYTVKESDRFALLGLLNSIAATTRLKQINPGRFFQASYVNSLTVKPTWKESRKRLDELGRRLCQIEATLSSLEETSFFFSPSRLFHSIISVEEYTSRLYSERNILISELDRHGARIFGLGENDTCLTREPIEMRPGLLITETIGVVVGSLYGRWNITYESGGEASLVDIADIIVARSYPCDINTRGCLFVDDRGHKSDLAFLVWDSLESILKPSLSAQEIVGYLDEDIQPGVDGFRYWLSHKFFELHRGKYSHGRRKAPIYWQLATPSASYSVWCYYHRLTRDTFFRVANDYVTPKVDHEESKLNALRQEAGQDPSSKQRKEIGTQEAFVAELRTFATEIKRIAPLWNPNLNDGVIINFAPLWRLVSQHKAWQKECKKVWDKLIKGDYDWAHLAMHLWPERVVPKCQDDRSLAIAHGLEDEFWYEDEENKWQKRRGNGHRVEELVSERTSTAVKAALKDLLNAPTPSGQTRRKRRAST